MSTSTTSAPPGTEDPPEARAAPRRGKPDPAWTGWRRALRRDWQLYSLAILPLLFFLVFRYLPMIGNVIAFRRFEPGGSIFGEEWVGLRYVQMFLSDPTFWQVFRNTLWIGGLTLLFCFPVPIVLALLLNEVRRRSLKRFVQSVSYLPHFLSIVIVAGITMQMLASDGPVNHMLGWFGHEPIRFIQEPEWFRTIYVGSEIWQTAGWGTILYLAALTTIDEDLYEAARIDGANRWQQIWHVTLPGIRPTMVTLLILNIGAFMAVGFEKVLLLYNPLTYQTADVISTYVYRSGVESNSFSYAAAIGLFEAIIGLILITSANQLSRRTVGTSLW
ncbi:ABC transporter permease subunit [Streptomyces caelestis]|uniref:Putative aldouronate transport system permease protein n=1 Tax=Streptomyces caelestis TaxID=36816 RepID=A0A7W9LW57_9ACTN|nr:ABC transporter permease subunit [Streptomyces caelestis]MBB5798162.1 putative aldouronate transport system permease protein [Streptomyces caelestis]GGW65532.1 sugar ABC transporter permease [Streptomyces caelestis]